ncbi:MAG: glycosyltransferase family 39 protein [Deltaproteobacteria bacterium]|nr:glycosyltransferase family 39 protein [Deltaproteobacteria bacterium]
MLRKGEILNRFDEKDGRLPVVLLICLMTGASIWYGYLVATYLPWGMDEFATWGVATGKGYADLFWWRYNAPHPPLILMMVRFCTQITGLHDMWVLRLPSCLFTVLSIPAAYWLGRALWGRWMALALAAMISVSPYFS